MAGNMGLPFSMQVLDELKNPDKNRVYILECSSFQMEFVHHFSPNLVLYTNISGLTPAIVLMYTILIINHICKPLFLL